MARRRDRSKGRKISGPFVAVPIHILESQEYAELGAYAVKLLMDLFSQFNGRNNGSLSIAWRIMRGRGWKSKKTLYRALDELERRGWVVKTRQGGRHLASMYAVSWLGIDPPSKVRLDVSPDPVPRNSWRKNLNPWPPRCTNLAPLGGQ